jgi:beta-glucosidase
MFNKKMIDRTFSGTRSSVVSGREVSHRAVARRAAAEGMVLLKNEGGVLPLAAGSRVALYGSGASQTVKGGTGSGDVNERVCVSVYQGMKEAGYVVANEDWVADYDERYERARLAWRDDILAKSEGKQDAAVDFFAVYTSTPFVRPVGKKVEKTDADVAFYILSRVAGEGADRFAADGDYELTAEEREMLVDICASYEKVVVAVNTGGLVDLSFMDEYKNICGLLQIVQPGMEGGHAFADLVSGKVTPSGKLTDTWACKYEDYPNAENFSHNNGDVDHEVYKEGIYVGYRYFDTFEVPVRYGFGYGLSYTDFALETGSVSYDQEKKSLTIAVKVTNTGGTWSGREVVQVYVSCPQGGLEKEYRRLAAFEKTPVLEPGEGIRFTLEIPLDRLTSYDEKEPGWVLEPGSYGIWVGNSLQSAVLAASMELDGRAVLIKTDHICPARQEIEEFHGDRSRAAERYEAWKERAKEQGLPRVNLYAGDFGTEQILYRKNAELVEEETRRFVDTLSTEQLIALATGDPGKGQGGNLGAAGISVPGSAGETNGCAAEQYLASIVLADGPAGLRLMKYYHVADGKIVSMPFQFSLEGGLFCPDTGDLPGERYYQYCTAIPVGTLLAQTWDKELLREIGEMIGREMEEFGVTLWLAPGMNIHRNPLCGRNFEYYSEDPLVSGKMAAAITEGVQRVPGCGTTIKHFACNNQEDNRMGSDSILSERALREIYLKGFEIAVKESQPMAIMTSYNLINGVHAANNYDICTKAARNEWGFAGVIMTDWTTTEKDESCTASGCMRAGNDLVMPGCPGDYENLRRELDEGKLSLDNLKACISRLVRVIWQSNQYEGAVPYKK